MKRANFLLMIFICWGAVIACASIWIISVKKDSLLAFSRKVAAKNIIFHPLRAPILDRNGKAVCFSAWEFFAVFRNDRRSRIKNFCTALNMPFRPEIFDKKNMQIIIPDEYIADAVKNADKYRIRIRRRSVRKQIFLPPAVQFKAGIVIGNQGITGWEKKFNDTLQGSPGFYNVIQGPDGRIETNSFRVIAPMQEGKAVYLPYSVEELQSDIGGLEVWW